MKVLNFKVSEEIYEKIQQLRQEKALNVSLWLRNMTENNLKNIETSSNNSGGGLA